MITLGRPIRCGILALALTVAAHEAGATAIAAVEYNGFIVKPLYGQADGVLIGSPINPITGIGLSVSTQILSQTQSTSGSGTVHFTTDASTTSQGVGSATIAGNATAIDPLGYAFGSLVYEVTFNFTNLTGVDLDFLTVLTTFSAFNPGPSFSKIGASVDNSIFEFARYDSSQTGPAVNDSHHCDTRVDSGPANPTFPTVPPAVACGVEAHDSSDLQFSILDFDANETVSETFTLRLDLEARSAPEPATFALFGAALTGLAGFRFLQRRA
jgi:hypothetical protein